MPSFSPLTSQGAESYATGHEIIEGDFAVGAVALHDGVHCLRAQIITCTGTHTLLNNNTFIHRVLCLRVKFTLQTKLLYTALNVRFEQFGTNYKETYKTT